MQARRGKKIVIEGKEFEEMDEYVYFGTIMAF